MNNKKLGNSFETELCELLSAHGFWVHNLAQNASGQPADVIAVRNKKAYLIDCKVCTSKGFDLRRMEENQDLAMSLWKDCGNGEGWFAIELGGVIYMITHSTMASLRRIQSALTCSDVHDIGEQFEMWVAKRCK